MPGTGAARDANHLPPKFISRSGWQRVLRAALALAGLALTLFARSAYACPSCAPSLAARAQIFDEGFFRNLAVAVLPFLLVGAVCFRVQQIGRRRA